MKNNSHPSGSGPRKKVNCKANTFIQKRDFSPLLLLFSKRKSVRFPLPQETKRAQLLLWHLFGKMNPICPKNHPFSCVSVFAKIDLYLPGFLAVYWSQMFLLISNLLQKCNKNATRTCFTRKKG